MEVLFSDFGVNVRIVYNLVRDGVENVRTVGGDVGERIIIDEHSLILYDPVTTNPVDSRICREHV